MADGTEKGFSVQHAPCARPSSPANSPAATLAERGKHTWEILSRLTATCQQTGRDFVQAVRPYLVIQPA